jgi:hypothetical protein
MKKLSNSEFIDKAKSNSPWVESIEEEYSSKKENILVKGKCGHIILVPCKNLTRNTRLMECPVCKKENTVKYCLNCGKKLKKGQKKFCSQSCSATFNNKGRKIKKDKVSLNEDRYCLNCGKILTNRHQKKFCSSSCQADFYYKERIKKWKENPESEKRETKIPYIKHYLEEKFNHKCQLCGWDKVHPITGKVPLEVHHINGIASDNREENLQLLCPNCHSLTETYRGLNSGSGRKKRY